MIDLFDDTALLALRARRKFLRFNQEQLGERMGVSQNRVSNLENMTNLSTLQLGILQQWVEALGGRLVVSIEVPRSDEGEQHE
jgi:transcriptional regulator with XRE-family HTH domain